MAWLEGWEAAIGEASDGVWWARMKEGVARFNKDNNTNYDPLDAVLAWRDGLREDD